MVAKDIITDYICNNCGHSCKKGFDYEGLLEAKVVGGYSSEQIGDMICWKFSLCEDCLKDISSKFKIPVERIDLDAGK